VLPHLGQLSFLRNLDIAGATEVTQLGHEFTGFRNLKVFSNFRRASIGRYDKFEGVEL
jgi:hypothetical protein